METQQIEISFFEVDEKTAVQYGDELKEYIRSYTPELDITDFDRKRAISDAQDIGSILLLILSSELAVAVAKEIVKGIAEWLAQKDMIKLKITSQGRTVEIEYHRGMSQEDVLKLIAETLAA